VQITSLPPRLRMIVFLLAPPDDVDCVSMPVARISANVINILSAERPYPQFASSLLLICRSPPG
jgi:hypothetical protein